MNVVLPRLDDARKSAYQTRVARYGASGGELMFVEETGEEVKYIQWSADDGAVRDLRTAGIGFSRGVPIGRMAAIGLGQEMLQPGD